MTTKTQPKDSPWDVLNDAGSNEQANTVLMAMIVDALRDIRDEMRQKRKEERQRANRGF